MNKILNIINGDAPIKAMQEAGVVGDILPWRDILHDGPVPAGLSLEALSNIRAEFIVSRGWGDNEKIKQDFIDRDNQLKAYQNYEKVVLWFEHDLYDQLQIIQILDWFNKISSNNSADKTQLILICTENYLGMLSADEIKTLQKYESPITTSQLILATRAWNAFCAPEPTAWAALLAEDISTLPFLEGAILRQLEEYPDCKTGLSRTAYQALKIFSQGETRCGKVFGDYCKTEERRFLGDLSFWFILDEMANATPPLLIFKETQLRSNLETVKPTDDLVMTKTGEDVLNERSSLLDHIEIDRWIGGNHLTPDNIWCWDADNTVLVTSN